MLNGSVIVALVLEQALHFTGADAVFGIALPCGCCGARFAHPAKPSTS